MATSPVSTVLQRALETQCLTLQQVRDALSELPPGATPAEVTQFLVRKGYLLPTEGGPPASADAVPLDAAPRIQVLNAPLPPPSMPDLAGRPFGRFDIVRELGRGGMGVVYEASLRSSGGRVALKVLPASLGEDPQVVARFEREARSASKLRHPNIVRVYGGGIEERLHYIAMDLVEGGSVADLVDGGPLDPRTAVAIARAVADALAYAHSVGVIHRDLKPSNILLDGERRPFLMDFGLARDAGAVTQTATGMVLGTIAYMPPEQARGEHVDARADVYGLGAALYEMLTGRRPFQGETWQRLLPQVLLDEPPPPRAMVPSIPAALEAVVLRAMEKDKARRYATMEALRDAVGECASAHGV